MLTSWCSECGIYHKYSVESSVMQNVKRAHNSLVDAKLRSLVDCSNTAYWNTQCGSELACIHTAHFCLRPTHVPEEATHAQTYTFVPEEKHYREGTSFVAQRGRYTVSELNTKYLSRYELYELWTKTVNSNRNRRGPCRSTHETENCQTKPPSRASIRGQSPSKVRDIYLDMWPATQVNSAWPSLRV